MNNVLKKLRIWIWRRTQKTFFEHLLKVSSGEALAPQLLYTCLGGGPEWRNSNVWPLHVLSKSKTSTRGAFIILKELWDFSQWKLKSEFCIKSIHSALIYTLKSSVCGAQIKAEAWRAPSPCATRDGGAEFTARAVASPSWDNIFPPWEKCLSCARDTNYKLSEQTF